ncbi:hypothetical protein BDV18DRAFT_156184 [Aspergillus unguis]
MSEIYDWLVQIPISKEKLQAWSDARDAHIAHLKTYVANGTIVFGGPTLAQHPKTPTDRIEATGSVFMLRAQTEQEVWKIVEENPFVAAGVWDLKQVVVSPFSCGVRTAKE